MLVGVDIGTQSLKVAVADATLAVKGEAQRFYRAHFAAAGHAEQDPQLWEEALGPAIAEALAAADVPAAQVTALAVCGQLDGCIPVSERGEALGHCLTWMDRRASAELADLDQNYLHQVTGVVPDASHQGAKIRWLKRHDEYKAARYHQPVSYLVERLTGEAVIDHAQASTSMLYGLAAQAYDSTLLSAFGVTVNELPAIARADEIAGGLTSAGAALTGLSPGIAVAVGTGDDFSAALGAGVIVPGQASVAVGTGEVVGAVFADPVIDPERLVETHAYPAGGYFVENPGWLSGGAVAWLRDLLRLPDFTAFDAEAAKAPPGSADLLFLPALTGATAPEWNAAARGCFYGLTPAHGAPHLARATLEGCSFAMRDVLDRLNALGAAPKQLVMLGGGSQSRIWAQIRADVARLPVAISPSRHGSVMGALMLAAVATGRFSDLRQAATCIARPSDIVTPDAIAAARLDHSYRRYRQLFTALKDLFPQPSEST
jgi:xylulokinase